MILKPSILNLIFKKNQLLNTLFYHSILKLSNLANLIDPINHYGFYAPFIFPRLIYHTNISIAIRINFIISIMSPNHSLVLTTVYTSLDSLIPI